MCLARHYPNTTLSLLSRALPPYLILRSGLAYNGFPGISYVVGPQITYNDIKTSGSPLGDGKLFLLQVFCLSTVDHLMLVSELDEASRANLWSRPYFVAPLNSVCS